MESPEHVVIQWGEVRFMLSNRKPWKYENIALTE